jgi:hypothetical protein
LRAGATRYAEQLVDFLLTAVNADHLTRS